MWPGAGVPRLRAFRNLGALGLSAVNKREPTTKIKSPASQAGLGNIASRYAIRETQSYSHNFALSSDQEFASSQFAAPYLLFLQ